MKHKSEPDEEVVTRTKVNLTTASPSGFFLASQARARKLDRGEKVPSQVSITFEDPSDLIHVLSTARLRVLQFIRTKPIAMSELARNLQRDRQAVSRDVRLLESFGLLKTREEPNPGHGRRIIVEPLAASYRLVANI